MSRVRRTSVLVMLAIVVAVPAVRAQSLAELADRTTKERKGSPASKSYGDADLKPTREESAARAGREGGSAAGVEGIDPDSPREDVVRAVMPGVVTIESGPATGTGFFISADTVLTNRHVIAASSSVRVKFSDGTTSAGAVSATASDADLALVHIDQPPSGHPVLRLAPARQIRVGEEVLAVGSALGTLQGTVTRGIVSAVRTGGGLTIVQTDAAINPGNSGGPLVNRAGAVVGITTAKMNNAESLGFAIATDHASELIRGNTSVLRADRTGDPSIETALSDGGRSESDLAREGGLAQYEQRVEGLAQSAGSLDAQWRRFRDECRGRPMRGAPAAHEWFGIWLDGKIDPDLSAQCSAIRDYLVTQGKAVEGAMLRAGESARQAGVFPGSMRAVREKHAMDWDGWDR
ncbi:MAG: trypsin-like peptidase domain-containing protein [Vicinamibacterales bacterium]